MNDTANIPSGKVPAYIVADSSSCQNIKTPCCDFRNASGHRIAVGRSLGLTRTKCRIIGNELRQELYQKSNSRLCEVMRCIKLFNEEVMPCFKKDSDSKRAASQA